MGKKRNKAPDLLEPNEILAATFRRQLRPGEANVLAQHMADLERSLANAEATISRLRMAHAEVISQKYLGIGLDASGAIELQFPDQHSVRIPVGLLQADNALAMAALLRVLRERQLEGAKHIGTKAAPTQQDLTRTLRQVRAAGREPPVKRAEPRKPAPLDISLSDLDLDI